MMSAKAPRVRLVMDSLRINKESNGTKRADKDSSAGISFSSTPWEKA